MQDNTVSIPKNVLKPPYERVFCVAFEAPDSKIKMVNTPDLIVPSDLKRTNDQTGEEVTINLERYFVVDIHPECRLHKEDGVKRGDEIAPFIPDSAIGYDPVKVMDFGNGKKYIVMHESEIGGFMLQKDFNQVEEKD